MELVLASLILLAIYRLDIDATKKLFFIIFTLTGGIQFLLVLINPGIEVSDGMGFTNSLRASSSFPSEIEYALLVQTITLWAFYCYMLYLTFKFSFENKTPVNIIMRTNALSGNFHYLRASLFLSLVYVVFNYAGEFFSAYLAPPIRVAAIAFLLTGFVSYNVIGKRILNSPAFLISLLLIVMPAIIDFSRGQIFMPFFGIIILVYFLAIKSNLSIGSYLSWVLIGIMMFFITTIFKLYLGAVVNEYGSFFFYLQGSLNDEDGLISILLNSLLSRLNGSQALYWYLYDIQYGPNIFISDRSDSLFYFFSTLIPGALYSGSELRFVSGMPLEQWLFLNYTGVNFDGGYAIPPLVEFTWATHSIPLGLFVTMVTFILLSCFFRLFVTYTKFGGPCLTVLCFYIFLKSESISILALFSIKYFPIAILVCYLTYRALRLFKLFTVTNHLNEVR